MKNYLTLFLLLFASAAFAQTDFTKISTGSVEDCKAAEPQVLEAANLILSKPVNDASLKDARSFLIRWMTSTEYSFTLDSKVLDMTKKKGNENLLAVKQLLNIADAAENELDEAIARGDRAEQVHQFGQITIASEKSAGARDEAQACIGEELHFVGKNDLTVDGPAIRNDPTDDGDLGEPGGEDPFDTAVTLEDPAFASPFMPL